MTILSTNVTGIFQWSPEIAKSESTRFEDLFLHLIHISYNSNIHVLTLLTVPYYMTILAFFQKHVLLFTERYDHPNYLQYIALLNSQIHN